MYIFSAVLGIISGILSGLIGIGGGIIMIPALVFFLKFDQHLAQGTTLAAMIPPIGILAAYEYYRAGQVNIPVALIIAAFFLVGGLIGAKLAVRIDEALLKKVFGVVLLAISVKMIFFD